MTTIVVADHDDPDVLALCGRGAQESIVWLQLARAHTSYDVRWSVHDAVLESGSTKLSSSDIKSARRILFRRWRVAPPAGIVSVGDRETPESVVMEREWASTLDEVFGTWWSVNPAAFSRRPDHYPGKLSLMRLMSREVRVPPFVVATSFAATDAQSRVVTKLISTDQSFGTDQRTATIDADLAVLKARQPCPTLLQTRVDGSIELRLAYSFGSMAAVAQRQSGEHPVCDIRTASHVERWPFELTRALREEISRVAGATGLSCFTADVLVDALGDRWWLDVNPDGLFIAADCEEGTLLDCLQDGLSTGLDR